ncbi:SRPBCC family protein [Mycobacterium sp. 21AC1]|uniref:SRPBCC family protein n=1 Tax=[Mycobacterium] appelbergii TaxID=2939269 RepID=UPI002938E2BA|nr:SRPBCC family protein [Mycobacterium sp. 21AC1]MDV3130167.1 SRPBCC family protein [Mycobacterium sp. 21AC1]
MKLHNTVAIPAAPGEVFALIQDVERIAVCVPGATLAGRDGDAYSGSIKVRVGPISAAYDGRLRFVTTDEDRWRIVLDAKGVDSHGGGDAQAHVELAVIEVDGGSELRVDTDLVLSGKIVAFGKGAIVAVSNKLMEQFANNVAALLQSGPLPQASAAVAAGAPARPTRQSPAQEPAFDSTLDLLSMVPPGAKKAVMFGGVFLAGIVEGWLISRAFPRRR